jgi:membrane-bound serine protease (ClpP class)
MDHPRRAPLPPHRRYARPPPLANFAITALPATLIISLIARFLPEIPIFRRVILATHSPVGPAITTLIDPTFDLAVLPGDSGVTRSPLRPSGKAEIGAALHDVITDGEFVESGTPVRVVTASPSRIVVRAIA